jgi:hypothetical protein
MCYNGSMPRARLHQAQTYLVTIEYREPTYELRVGPKTRPFGWTYEIVAADESSARESALREFWWVTRASSVGWVREVVGVHVRRDPR